MSKILVDVMPKRAEECPFVEYIHMTSKNACRLKTGLYSRCNLECGKECEQLIDIEHYTEKKQKDIDRYVEQKNEQLITLQDPFGYKCGVIFAERYFSELGNRLCELNPDIDYVAMIDISRGTVSYRCTRDDIDLGGEIAHSFGGGGHRKAAGSRFDGQELKNMIIDFLFITEEEKRRIVGRLYDTMTEDAKKCIIDRICDTK